MSTNAMENQKIVSQYEWLAARQKLFAKEKLLTRERDDAVPGNTTVAHL
jgi:predicted dithiol-disulfide oxidoreductase (DUF899 family)